MLCAVTAAATAIGDGGQRVFREPHQRVVKQDHLGLIGGPAGNLGGNFGGTLVVAEPEVPSAGRITHHGAFRVVAMNGHGLEVSGVRRNWHNERFPLCPDVSLEPAVAVSGGPRAQRTMNPGTRAG